MIADFVKTIITEEYNNGTSQLELSKKYKIPQVSISKLLSGKKSFSGLSIGTLDKMFPNAVLHIYGDKVNINAAHNNGNVVGINHGKVSNNKDVTEAILNEVMDSEKLSAEAKVEVFNIVKKINK